MVSVEFFDCGKILAIDFKMAALDLAEMDFLKQMVVMTMINKTIVGFEFYSLH